MAFRVTGGSGTLSAASVQTDANGRASTQLTLGSASGAVEVTASVEGTTLSTLFTATARVRSTPGTQPSAVACDPGTATAWSSGLPAPVRDEAFEARLRAARARDLRPRVAAARAWYAARAGAGSAAPGVRRAVIPGNVRVGTVAHEYEHLINSSRRLYLNPEAQDFEETWLDEGPAHVAEELVFYHRSRLGPRQNIDATALRASGLVLNAFGDLGIANFDRLGLFLVNLRGVFDGELTALFRDWATTLLVDAVAGVAPRFQFPSWNLRSVFGLPDVRGGYPLKTTPLAGGASSTVTLYGGAVAYLRFAVGAGKAGAVSWNTLPSTVMLSLVRLR